MSTCPTVIANLRLIPVTSVTSTTTATRATAVLRPRFRRVRTLPPSRRQLRVNVLHLVPLHPTHKCTHLPVMLLSLQVAPVLVMDVVRMEVRRMAVVCNVVVLRNAPVAAPLGGSLFLVAVVLLRLQQEHHHRDHLRHVVAVHLLAVPHLNAALRRNAALHNNMVLRGVAQVILAEGLVALFLRGLHRRVLQSAPIHRTSPNLLYIDHRFLEAVEHCVANLLPCLPKRLLFKLPPSSLNRRRNPFMSEHWLSWFVERILANCTQTIRRLAKVCPVLSNWRSTRKRVRRLQSSRWSSRNKRRRRCFETRFLS
mmetsp:Transcript_8213/g.25429  ORF Transcript_8213/g.25429 Transcript_8213/m.25429 type:complete len:311 (-) Transcript_8213:748-1680(-)